jgi:hypothetical protein
VFETSDSTKIQERSCNAAAKWGSVP